MVHSNTPDIATFEGHTGHTRTHHRRHPRGTAGTLVLPCFARVVHESVLGGSTYTAYIPGVCMRGGRQFPFHH